MISSFLRRKKKNYVGISLGSQIIYSGADKSSSTKKTGVRTENKDGKKITRVVRVYYTAQDNADSGKFKKKLSKVKPLNKYEKTVYSYLRNQGYSEYAAAGIMGNWIAESSYNPASVNSYGYSGIAQWGGGRLRKLKNLAQSKGKNWTNLLIQLQFFTKETKETGSYKEFQSKKFKETKNILKRKFRTGTGWRNRFMQDIPDVIPVPFPEAGLEPAPELTIISAKDR